MQNPLISTSRIYAAYKNHNQNMMAILSHPNIAEQAIITWVARNFASYQDLATKPYDRNATYIRNEYMGFSGGYVNVGTLSTWSGHQTTNIHRKLSQHKILFDLFDTTICADDRGTGRREFAIDRGMWRYERISTRLYMLCPRTCAAFLFLSRGELPIDFRTFIGDHSPEDTYHPRKLHATLTQPIINVNSVKAKVNRGSRRIRRVSP